MLRTVGVRKTEVESSLVPRAGPMLAEKGRTAASAEPDATNLEINLRRPCTTCGTTAHSTGADRAVQDTGIGVDALGSVLKECTELHSAADGAHQDLAALAERDGSLGAARPNNGEALVVSLCDVAMESTTRNGAGEAESKGDAAASEHSGGKPSVDESSTLGNDDDSDGGNDSECRDGNGCKLGDQEVVHSFATVGNFLARFYCQDSREYWHTDNMLSSQQFGSPTCAQLPRGRSAGMAGCVFCVCVYV